MELAEKEVIIRINKADLAEGWFSYYTSEAYIADNVKKKFSNSVKNCKTTKDRLGKITSWDFTIDAAALAEVPYLAKRQKKTLTDEQREAARMRFKAVRVEKLAAKTDSRGEG